MRIYIIKEWVKTIYVDITLHNVYDLSPSQTNQKLYIFKYTFKSFHIVSYQLKLYVKQRKYFEWKKWGHFDAHNAGNLVYVNFVSLFISRSFLIVSRKGGHLKVIWKPNVPTRIALNPGQQTIISCSTE